MNIKKLQEMLNTNSTNSTYTMLWFESEKQTEKCLSLLRDNDCMNKYSYESMCNTTKNRCSVVGFRNGELAGQCTINTLRDIYNGDFTCEKCNLECYIINANRLFHSNTTKKYK